MPAGCMRSIFTAIGSSPMGFARARHAVASPRGNAKREDDDGDEKQVAQHYGSAGIAERVLAALREANGPDAPVTPDALAPLDHFHGRGVVATAGAGRAAAAAARRARPRYRLGHRRAGALVRREMRLSM